MAAVTGFLKYAGFFAIALMIAASIVLLVFGSNIKKGTDLGNKNTTGNVFYAFGSMNMIAILIVLAVIFAGCPKCPEVE